MSSVAVIHKIDPNRLAEGLQEALVSLNDSAPELVLDFSDVQRVKPDALKELESLAKRAEEKSVRPVLRGVNVDVYKVLKLARLTSRFTFAN